MNNFNSEIFKENLNKKAWKLAVDLEKYTKEPKEHFLASLVNGEETIRSLEVLRNIRKEQNNPNLKTYTTNEIRSSLGLNPI